MLLYAIVERHPYSYYTLLRWICCSIFAYSATTFFQMNRVPWSWVFGVLAALYNPIFPVHLARGTWAMVNWLTIGAMVTAAVVFRRPDDKRPSTTMTISEAEHILDIVSVALQDDSHPFGRHPISSLKGYDMFSILTALKLRIANEFLQLIHRAHFEKQFADGLKLYDSIPWQIMSSFVEDDQVGKIGAAPVLSPTDRTTMKFSDARLASIETGTSFADYCKSVGPKDPNYWQKIYARIGIEHTATSPRGNLPAE